jgi:hypothetical protein
MFKPSILFAGMLCFSSAIASAQTPDTASIRGTVADSTRAAIPGATIQVTNNLTGLMRSTVSGPDGSFVIAGLPIAGEYKVGAEKQGFAETHLDHLTLVGGSTAAVNLDLNVAGGNTDVTVLGEAGEVRTDQPQLGDRLEPIQMEDTPLPNRRITFLPLLNAANRPAINQGDIFMDQDLFTTNGAGRRQTWFEVDGVSGNDSWGRQTIFTNIPLSAVQEMTVLTNSFSAEYGASTGSVVNIVTKSGGHAYHGDFLGLWRPTGPEASLAGFNENNATSGNEVANDRLIQESFGVSGPVKFLDKTEFFLASEHSDEDKASPVTSPLAPGNYEGVYHDWMTFLRLDHQFTEKNNGFFRADQDAYFDTNPNGIVGGSSLPTVARIFRRRTYSMVFGDTAELRPNLLNSAHAQFQLASPITEFDPVVYGTQFVVTIPTINNSKFTTGTSQAALLMNRQYEMNDVVSITARKNQINIGADAIIAHTGGNSKEFGGPSYLGAFTFLPCNGPAGAPTALQIEEYCETTWISNIANVQSYTQSFGNASYTVNDAIWSIFAQDDFHASDKLTLNAGLRYERQTFTDAMLNLAPRLGFVYDVAGRGRFVVSGGFGIYYSQIVDNDEANYALTGPTGVFTYTATPGTNGFPTSIAAAPLPTLPTGYAVPLRSLYIRPGDSRYYNQFFPTSTLVGYPNKLLNPYSEQYTLSVQQQLAPNWVLTVEYVGTHQLRNVRPLDVDAPASFVRTSQGQYYDNQSAANAPNYANCARPYWIYFFQQRGTVCPTTNLTSSTVLPPYSVIQSDVNDGFLHYDALDVNLRHVFSNGFETLVSYTWSHTLDNVDPDATSQNPNDPLQTGLAEYGNALYDQRNRLVLSGLYVAPWNIHIGGVATLAGGLPYNLTTGATNSGDTGATTDRPVINGVVVGRNTGRGTPVYDVDPFISRAFPIFHERLKLDLRVEAFNALNHANFVTFNGVYGNTNTVAPASLGVPSYGVTAQLPARSLQFSGKFTF